MPVVGPLGRGARIAAAAEHNAALGELGPGQLGGGGGVLGPAPRLVDRGGRDHARRRTHPPARGGEAVALGRDHHEVVAGEREVDGLLPAVDPDGAADQGVEHRLGDRSAVAHPHVAPHGLGAAAGRELAGPDRGRRLPGRQDGPGDAALAQGGQGGLGRAPSVDHDGGDTGADGRLEGGVPALVDLHQVDQRADDAVDVAQQFAPARALQVRQRAFECLGPGRRAVAPLLGLVGRHLCRLRPARRFFERRTARRQLGLERRRRLLQLVRLLGQEVGAHRRARRPLLERADAAPERVHVLLLARRGAGHRVDAGADPGDGLIGGVVPEHRGPALPQRGRLVVEGGQRRDSSSRSGAPPASSSASAVTSSLARRAASASRVETTSTSAAASRAATTPRPRSRSTPVSPRARSTSPCTRPRALARSSSRRDDSSAVVEVASASSCSSASCSSSSSSRHTARCCAAARRRALRSACSAPARYRRSASSSVATVSCERRRGRLPLERPDLAPHLAHQVAQALQVLGRPGQPALGPLAAAPVLQHPGRLLDDGPAVLGPGVEHGVELALADDHVLLAAHARVARAAPGCRAAGRAPR